MTGFAVALKGQTHYKSDDLIQSGQKGKTTQFDHNITRFLQLILLTSQVLLLSNVVS